MGTLSMKLNGVISVKLKEVKYVSDYSIELVFDDGVRGIVHLNDLVEKGIFKVCKIKNALLKFMQLLMLSPGLISLRLMP